METKIIKLRELLNNYLTDIHPNVFYEKAEDPVPYPHLVFEITNTIEHGEGHSVIMVDIDGWSRSSDTLALETIMANVQGDGNPFNPSGLNLKVFKDDEFVAKVHTDRRLVVSDSDKNIRRRKYIYAIHIYERS